MSEPAARGEELAAFGRWLVRERELRGLGRDEVARATKLAPGVVEALESGEEGRIPPHAYVVGYLRAYAQAVGLDADEVVLRFQEAAGPIGAPASGARARSPRGKAPRVKGPQAKAPQARAPEAGASQAKGSQAKVPPRVALAAVVGLVLAAAVLWALLGS